MLKFGLFGVGRIGRMRARILAANHRVELAGIYDVDADAVASAATETGSVSVDSVDALLGDPTLDAVCISSSTSTHCDLIEGAARTGKAVFCEKPIHLDMERADACGAVLAETGVPFQIGFNRRFDPNHGEVHRAARNGEIGRLEQAVISSRDPYPPPLRFLRGSGGIYRDMMVHDFDMARFLFNEEPVEVTAMGSVLFDARCEEFGDADSAMVVLRMASGALCHVNCSRHCSFGYDQRIELFGEGGMLVSANPTRTSIERYTASGTSARDRLHPFFIERYEEAFTREIDAFVDAVEQGVKPSPGFDDGRRALRVAEAAEESARSGRTVRVGE
ncbi:MAG: inositol 2-dehydrogenase [Acidobacteriota bacterium]|nr:inositol 2-dehydrogenase [Acidobacteriota bacterium]